MCKPGPQHHAHQPVIARRRQPVAQAGQYDPALDQRAFIAPPPCSHKPRRLAKLLHNQHGAGTAETAATNTTAINDARTAAGTNGVVFFPGLGTFAVNALTASVAGQTWHLQKGCTLSLAASQNVDLITVSGAGVTIEGEGHLSVLDQNGGNQSSGSGMWVNNVADVTLRHFRMTDTNVRGITTTGSDRFTADGLTIDATGEDGIVIEINSDDCLIKNCTITDGPATGDADCISIHGTSGSVHGARVFDNYLEPNGTAMFAIEIGAFGGTSPVERVQVRGNLLVSTAASFGGISIDSCEGAIVADNTYDQGAQAAIHPQGLGGPFPDLRGDQGP